MGPGSYFSLDPDLGLSDRTASPIPCKPRNGGLEPPKCPLLWGRCHLDMEGSF